MEIIIKREQELRQAMLDSNIEALDELIDQKLKFTIPNGQLITKEDDLENYRSGLQNITRLDIESLEVMSLGLDVTVSFVSVSLDGDFDSHSLAGRYKYIRIWQKIEGSFKVVAGQVCLIQV